MFYSVNSEMLQLFSASRLFEGYSGKLQSDIDLILILDNGFIVLFLHLRIYYTILLLIMTSTEN